MKEIRKLEFGTMRKRMSLSCKSTPVTVGDFVPLTVALRLQRTPV